MTPSLMAYDRRPRKKDTTLQKWFVVALAITLFHYIVLPVILANV